MAAKKVDGAIRAKTGVIYLQLEDASWKLIDGTELFFKGATISNDLFKETSKYLDVKEKRNSN